MEKSEPVTVGVLAIQGAVSEHEDALKSLGAHTVQIRNPEDFENCDGIVLPGGESTTMAIVGEENGLFPKLKTWVQSNKPIWGTCAGMILLSDHAIKTALGGQSLVGGLDVHVCRNYFGSQIHSCILDIKVPDEIQQSSTETTTGSISNNSSTLYPAVFIRAPAILATGPSVQILSTVTAQPHKSAQEEVEQFYSDKVVDDNNKKVNNNSQEKKRKSSSVSNKKQKVDTSSSFSTTQTSGDSTASQSHEVIVAVRKGNILATAFHPELTMPVDLRWHQYFLNMVQQAKDNQTSNTSTSNIAATNNVADDIASIDATSTTAKSKTPKKGRK